MLLLRSFPVPFLRGGALAEVFVGAASALGASHARIIVRHILPNAVSSIIELDA